MNLLPVPEEQKYPLANESGFIVQHDVVWNIPFGHFGSAVPVLPPLSFWCTPDLLAVRTI